MLALSQIQMSNGNRIRNAGLSLNLSHFWDPQRTYCSSRFARLGIVSVTTHHPILLRLLF